MIMKHTEWELQQEKMFVCACVSLNKKVENKVLVKLLWREILWRWW